MNESMEEYTLKDIKLGLKKEFKIIITESMINEFAKLSGDYNPLHTDNQYAGSTSFKQRICHGMLLASFFSRLVGMHIPGKNALYIAQSLKFISPCYINDEIIVEGEVLDKSEATRIINIKTKITNSSGNSLVEGQAKVIIRE